MDHGPVADPSGNAQLAPGWTIPKPSKRAAPVLLVIMAVAWVVLVVAGFVFGYGLAPHDRVLLGEIGALGGAAVHMVGCWIVDALLAPRLRESRNET